MNPFLKLSVAFILISSSLNAQTYSANFDQKEIQTPFLYSVAVPEGNWKVTVTLGSDTQEGNTTVRVESSRLMIENHVTIKGENAVRTFTVNRRSPEMEDDRKVSLKADVALKLNWDDSLNFEFTGPAPCVRAITIEPADVMTVFLFGDSTVCDYDGEPYASWGQMITSFFDAGTAFANYAETGETTNSCISSRRFEKGLSQVRKGDFVLLEFGHNDEKQTRPGSGAWYLYSTNLKIMIDRIREKGGNPVLLTPTQRRRWKDGQVIDSHGDFPKAMRTVAERENVPLIDLTELTARMYMLMGEEDSKLLLTHLPAGSLEGLTKDLEDNTHFSPLGAYMIARCITQQISDMIPDLGSHIIKGWTGFDISSPICPEQFTWTMRSGRTYSRPRGN